MTKRTMICTGFTALLCVGACSSSHEDEGVESTAGASLEACNPFSMEETAITLENPVAIGRDTEGVTYVLDDASDDLHAFISDGDTLFRHRVLGSGAGKDGDTLSYRADVEADEPLTLDARIDGDGVLSFTKLDTLEETDDKRSLEGGEKLESLGESDIEDMIVRNLRPEIELEYFAAIEDGRFAVVVRPRDDWSYEDFRLFLGNPDRMDEGSVQSVVRARDGGSTGIKFIIGGAPAELAFPVTIETGPGPATLQHAGVTFAVERLDNEPEMAAGFAYYCMCHVNCL